MKIRFSLFKQWLISVFNPPYQLILEEIITDSSINAAIYQFKLYGSHDYIKISYKDICDSVNMMQTINPYDLKRIHLHEHQLMMENKTYKITEVLRNNEYVLENHETAERHTGDYIRKNLDMFINMEPSDLWKIAHDEGLTKGRKMSLDIINNNGIKVMSELKSPAIKKADDNVVSFRNFKR